MDVYSDFVFGLDKKLKISLEAEKDNGELFSSWKINKILNNLNEVYYKNELLRNIEELILTGVKASDIWILNDSININIKYIKYGEGKIILESNEALEKLYYLGSPIPLYTNKYVMLLNLVFESFRKVYTICNQENVRIPNKSGVFNRFSNDYYNENTHIKNLIDFFKEIVLEENPKADSKNISKILSKMAQQLSGYNEEFIFLKNYKFEDNTEFPEQLKKYDLFDSVFKSHERPIIIVCNEDPTPFLNIQCFDFLASKMFVKSSPRFLETNSISQNSPFLCILSISVTCLPYLLLIVKSKYEGIKLKKKIMEDNDVNYAEIQVLESEIRQQDIVIDKLENFNKQFDDIYVTHKKDNVINGNLSQANQSLMNKVNSNKEANAKKGVELLTSNDLNLRTAELKNI